MSRIAGEAWKKKVAEWMKAKRATICVTTKRMAVVVTNRKGRALETEMQQVDLYEVKFAKKGPVLKLTPSEYHNVVLGVPGGSIDDVLTVAMAKYPMAVVNASEANVGTDAGPSVDELPDDHPDARWTVTEDSPSQEDHRYFDAAN